MKPAAEEALVRHDAVASPLTALPSDNAGGAPCVVRSLPITRPGGGTLAHIPLARIPSQGLGGFLIKGLFIEGKVELHYMLFL